MESEVIQIFRKRKLESEEMLLEDYPRPLKEIKKSKNPFTRASAYAFGRGIIKGLMP